MIKMIAVCTECTDVFHTPVPVLTISWFRRLEALTFCATFGANSLKIT